MDHGADVGERQEIEDVILAGFDVDFDFGKASDEGKRRRRRADSCPWPRHQALARQRRRRCHRELIDVLGQLVAVVDAAELDGALRGLRQGHARAAAFAEDALVRHLVILGLAAEILRGDLLQFLASRPSPPRDAARVMAWVVWLPPEMQRPRQILRRVAPGDVALLPRHAEHFGGHAVHVADRFGTEVADAGLDANPAIRA